MRIDTLFTQPGIRPPARTIAPRQILIATTLIIALVAFEIFNFDTTKYALANLLGDAAFANMSWAAILAVAFCAIDFAGLARMFTPEKGREEPKEVWYLMGAWLLGATMNAVMTWWAVSLTLLNHEFGNEVLSRAQLLKAVPIFVAVLVWLTRILFIGALSVAGDRLFEFGRIPTRPTASAAAPQLAANRQPARLKSNNAPGTRPQAAEPATQVFRQPAATRQQPTGYGSLPQRQPRPSRPAGRPAPMNMQGRD